VDQDLQDLIAAWFSDVDPGEARGRELIERLRTDRAFRQAFVGEVRMLGMTRSAQAGEPRWLRLEDELGWGARTRQSTDAMTQAILGSLRREALRRRSLRWVAAASVVLALIGAAALVRQAWHKEQSPGSQSRGAELAGVVRVENAVWGADGDLRPIEGEVVRQGRLCLVAGKVTVRYFGGVVLAVEGPADVVLRAPDELYCHYGRIRVRAAPGVAGFVIRQGQLEIVDFGCEVALDAPASGPARVKVFEGEAACSVLGPDGRSQASALLDAGRAIEYDAASGKLRPIVVADANFVELSREPTQGLDLAPGYRKLVLESKPWGYWRFNQIQKRRVINEIAGRPSLIARGSISFASAADRNSWAVFAEGDAEQVLLMDGLWAPARRDGYAVEFWVQPAIHRPGLSGQSAVFSLIAATPGRSEKHMALVELEARNSNNPLKPCAVRVLDRWPPEVWGGVNLFSRRRLLPSTWHHVVGQMGRGMLELYLDGELVAVSAAPLNDGDGAVACHLLVGRLKQFAPLSDLMQVRAFEGCLGELAVYEHTLTAEEIKQRFRMRGLLPDHLVAGLEFGKLAPYSGR
jgi:hypothetical protein